MLSRTADNLYWLARYVERAEYLARVLEATLRLTALPLAYVGSTNEWESAVATAGCRKAFFARYTEANEENVSEFLAFSADNPSSIRNCIEIARTNARAVRTALTTETWETINGAWLELKRFGNGPTSREEFLRFLHWVQETSLRFDGSAYRTMLRNDVYWFSRLGALRRARRQHRAHPRREVPHAAAGGRARRRPARLLPMGGDPAHGLGAHRLSLGVPREPQAVARRRPPDPQRADAALAGELLREPGALLPIPSPPPMAARARRSARPAPSAPGSRTAGWRKSSRPASTSSSANSSPTIMRSEPPSVRNI